MSKPKGPAIPEDTFNLVGHCCGVRFTGIADMQEGFPFRLTPEARQQLEAQGMTLPAEQGESPSPDPATREKISR